MATLPAIPVSFQFAVAFGRNARDPEAAFREVSGIGPEMEVEAVSEGGENRFVHQLPKGVKSPRLVLKRGIAPNSSTLVAWCKRTLETGLAHPIIPKFLQVYLLDASGNPLRAWAFENAYPVKWVVDPFESTKNQVAVETIELAYAFSEKVK
jgi:phage tail-like protein